MINAALKKIFGTKHERDIKKILPIVDEINSFTEKIKALTDGQLRGKTEEFRNRLADGETLDDILPEAFAVVREAADRVYNDAEVIKRLFGTPDAKRFGPHFDVQLIGGVVLHEGTIAEMKTGEGKTLVATLPLYLNALTGRGVHLVTVNDFLARRDALWMGEIYEFLGMTVGCLQNDMEFAERKKQYECDVLYGTNSDFGFDYLRDNITSDAQHRVQREHYYAIVDEVDSILIDEARTPHIISGPAEESTEKYYKLDRVVRNLRPEKDFTIDEKARTVILTEEGIAKCESMIGVSNLYDESHMEIIHHINQAMKAHALFKKDVDYVIKDGAVIIVDEFTGRLQPGRRYSDGLHQALEAKEGVKIERENQTLATISLQNYFRMYERLAGMTGTADTEAEEFNKIYKLDVVVTPTHKKMIRDDYPDLIYQTAEEKYEAIVAEIEDLHKKGRPSLVGTISIENSEKLSEMLKRKMIPHQVLNAKFHEMEANIIAKAGEKGAVTIATNMAGRGTDIVLGEGVVGLGGLHIIGTERHESRRIDNQLRGRSGRQGDPGSSRFYLSLEDDLMRIFGSDRIKGMMSSLGLPRGTPIEHRWITMAIEKAQTKVEAHNFDIRKHLLEYDDVMNKQREVIYERRTMILEGTDVKENIMDMIEEVVEDMVTTYAGKDTHPEDRDAKSIIERMRSIFGIQNALQDINLRDIKTDDLSEYMLEKVKEEYTKKENQIGAEELRNLERMVMLQVIDSKWKDHLYAMDHLKEGIGLRAVGQKDPLVEYKVESHNLFGGMIERIKEDVVTYLYRIKPVKDSERAIGSGINLRDVDAPKRQGAGSPEPQQGKKKQKVADSGINKIGRNDPCPCGSGKKYKKCCGI